MDWSFLLFSLLKIFVVFGVVMTMVAYAVLVERKVSAFIQDRVGPNRTAPFFARYIPFLGPLLTRWGMFQPIADALKAILKEDFTPGHVRKFYFWIAPGIAMVPALLTLAVIPFGSQMGAQKMVIADLDVGILYTFGIVSLGVYGIVLAGYAANSKYPFLGGIRSSAQLISYEISMGLSVIPIFMLVGSLNLGDVIEHQSGSVFRWHIVQQPIAFFIFLIAAFAETNRLPFDLPEAETELVGGYHTEYSSLKLGLMLLTEYIHLVASSFKVAVLFLGGWSLFGLESLSADPIVTAVLKLLVLCGKMVGLCIFAQFVRWTIPRFRFDQLMNLAWKVMIPLALLNLLAVIFVKQFGWSLIVLTGVNVLLFVGAGVLGARTRGTITNPKRAVKKMPPGLPAGVTYAGR